LSKESNNWKIENNKLVVFSLSQIVLLQTLVRLTIIIYITYLRYLELCLFRRFYLAFATFFIFWQHASIELCNFAISIFFLANSILKYFHEDKIYIVEVLSIVNESKNANFLRFYIIVIVRETSVKDIIFKAKENLQILDYC